MSKQLQAVRQSRAVMTDWPFYGHSYWHPDWVAHPVIPQPRMDSPGNTEPGLGGGPGDLEGKPAPSLPGKQAWQPKNRNLLFTQQRFQALTHSVRLCGYSRGSTGSCPAEGLPFSAGTMLYLHSLGICNPRVREYINDYY